MAIQFNQHKGAAQKSNITSYQYTDGDNSFRLVGDILARYVYWIKGENDKNIPLECLSFDRNKETFNNMEKTGYESTILILSVAGAMLLSVLTTVKSKL